jgi:hypothetical protein
MMTVFGIAISAIMIFVLTVLSDRWSLVLLLTSYDFDLFIKCIQVFIRAFIWAFAKVCMHDKSLKESKHK